jgi:hypothetical protein
MCATIVLGRLCNPTLDACATTCVPRSPSPIWRKTTVLSNILFHRPPTNAYKSIVNGAVTSMIQVICCAHAASTSTCISFAPLHSYNTILNCSFSDRCLPPTNFVVLISAVCAWCGLRFVRCELVRVFAPNLTLQFGECRTRFTDRADWQSGATGLRTMLTVAVWDKCHLVDQLIGEATFELRELLSIGRQCRTSWELVNQA